TPAPPRGRTRCSLRRNSRPSDLESNWRNPMATTSEATRTEEKVDFMPLHGIDHLEMWVGNAAQASFFFRNAYGFSEVAYAGLETGSRDRVSHVLEQGGIRLVLTGTLRAGTQI